MKPDVQKILTKLSENKVELAAEKVELAITDDIFKMVEKAEEAVKKLRQLETDQENLDKDFKSKINKVVIDTDKKAEKINDALKKVANIDTRIADVLAKAERAARDLGVAPSAIKDFAKLDKLYTEVDSAYKDANGYIYTGVQFV